jgi:hypothetical protein
MTMIKSFGHFWWDFIVGDDWRSAAGVAVAVATTAVLAHNGTNAWVLIPVAVVAVLYLTLRRAVR